MCACSHRSTQKTLYKLGASNARLLELPATYSQFQNVANIDQTLHPKSEIIANSVVSRNDHILRK